MEKIFVDVYLAFNLGDDLFLDILAKKYPDCEFTVNYVGSHYDEFISGYKNVNRRKYTLFNKIGQRLRLTDSIKNYDKIAENHKALIFLGGSIFREERYHKSLYKDRLKLVTEFKNRNKPVFILGANFGPYETKGFLNDYMKLFKLCDDVCFRDLDSYKLFDNLPQVRHASDIVFQMRIEDYITIGAKKNMVGFSIIDVRHKQGLYSYYDDYIVSTVKAINLVVKKGHDCCLMSFCELEGDLELIDEIKSHLSLETLKKVSVYNYRGNIEEVMGLITSFKLFIAARFHANILALLLGIGLIPIIYSNKTSNMLKDIGQCNILVTMKDLHLQYDENIINRGFDNKAMIEPLSKDSIKQFKSLDELLNISKEDLGI
ncbi:transferase [Virgibacillus phasianinus]|uniref:Transferase n=1 Tax=Virgibacillus phasianinus TaxID=2017483 RepID=A0A220U6N9_9BACI|nr:polysaccharide pyruvyl transferase family protein [Virgibacillus phasianinus]ASK63715.1 transferase [Virgibacillus phasianinus]